MPHLKRFKHFNWLQPCDKYSIPTSETCVHFSRFKYSNIRQCLDKCLRQSLSMYWQFSSLKLRNWVHTLDKTEIPTSLTSEWLRFNFNNFMPSSRSISSSWLLETWYCIWVIKPRTRCCRSMSCTLQESRDRISKFEHWNDTSKRPSPVIWAHISRFNSRNMQHVDDRSFRPLSVTSVHPWRSNVVNCVQPCDKCCRLRSVIKLHPKRHKVVKFGQPCDKCCRSSSIIEQ